MMNEVDKQRLKDAFKSSIAASPAADEPIKGMVNDKGENMTLRTLFTATMESESFYADIQRDIQKGLTTVDSLVEQISNTRQITPRR
jgi:hypothetical protein